MSTPQDNGITERKNRTFLEMVNVMLLHAKLNFNLWGKALLIVCHILNIILIKKNYISPYELWKGRKPTISYFKVWGSLQEIHSLPTEITNGLNFIGNYRWNTNGTRHIIFSTFLLPFIDGIPIKTYRHKCYVCNFHTVCRRQLLGTIYRQNTYGKLPTEMFCR